MFLSSINLRNIRKHTETKFEFADKLNYIVGGNGVGKTTILEAIYYLCTTKSCVTTTDSEAVRIGERGFDIIGFFSGSTRESVQIKYTSGDNKKMYILNNKPVNRFSDIVGKFPAVLLSPGDHSITQGYSSDRRKFVDSVISQASRTYLKILIEYNKILKQRTYLLNRLHEGGGRDYHELEAWNAKLITSGAEIIRHRQNFILIFQPYIKESFQKILFGKEEPKIYYYFLEGKYTDEYEKGFGELLDRRRDEEIRRGTNLVGPHKDDFIFEINEMSLRNFGSQGQHKTYQTALRFAEYFYLKDKTGKSPTFLLDDVFGELDAERAAAISNYLGEIGQAFITLTDFGNIKFLNMNKDNRVINISTEGKISYA
jgi:DNA replication and repair protein RecF